MSRRTYNLIFVTLLLLVVAGGAVAEAQEPDHLTLIQLERSVLIVPDAGTNLYVDWSDTFWGDYQIWSEYSEGDPPPPIEVHYRHQEAGYLYIEATLWCMDYSIPEWPIVWRQFMSNEFWFDEYAAEEVVVTEVAWSGTAASSADEWIELWNNQTTDVWLAGWTLEAMDGTPTIALTGTVPANGHFLLERTADDTVSDIPADVIYVGGLHNEGETLTLINDLGIVVDTVNSDGGAWPAGTSGTGSPPYASMERMDWTAPDSDTNWRTNDGITRNGLDADGNPINGTPTASGLVETHTVFLPTIMQNWGRPVRP